MSNSSYLASLTDGERERLCYYVLPELRNGRRSGDNVVIRSPLREGDDDPSLSVSLSKGLCHDFGTDEGFDLVTLAARLWECDAAETIARFRVVLEAGGPKSTFQEARDDSLQAASRRTPPYAATRRHLPLPVAARCRRHTPQHTAPRRHKAVLAAQRALKRFLHRANRLHFPRSSGPRHKRRLLARGYHR